MSQETQININKNALENLQALIKVSIPTIDFEQVLISPVEATTKHGKNSLVKITNKEGQSTLSKPVDFFYNRLDLSQFSNQVFLEGYDPEHESLKEMICQQAGIIFDLVEVTIGEISDNIYPLTITPKAQDNYLYIGTLQGQTGSPPV